MSKLRETLRYIVSRYERQAGIVSDLARQVFDNIKDELIHHAATGGRSKVVKISYPGCRGGYESHMSFIKTEVVSKLISEGLSVDTDHVDNDTLTVSW
jgi:hypothetical protein